MPDIDLRSDTVTRPTAAMREAMLRAPVGDDVYGEDPSVNALEAQAAELLGHQAGLFLPSGTQSNLVALLTHCGRGDEYIVGATAHTYRYEAGGAAALGGIQPQPVPFADDGTLDLDAVRAVIKPDDVHFARSRLLSLENTQAGRASGPAYFARARALCDETGLALHLDGARLFNAAVATGCAAADIGRHCHSVSVCLSKGLGAPVGSVLVGSRPFITEARRWRKMVGGGMRQAGMLAAAGSYALTHHVARLADDHANAERLAAAVNARLPGAASQHTNMVFVDLPAPELAALRQRLRDHGVIISGPRWVTHLDVGPADIERIARILDDGLPVEPGRN
ncbi:MAG: low-specificity L-threonine aldolase [Pseudomonadales bacterium]